MSVAKLISFIDRHTKNGTIFPGEPWGEGIGIEEEGINLVASLRANDWLFLYEELTKKSNCWIECLIQLLDELRTRQARQMIIHIALNGTKKNFFDAMECIRDFRRDVDIYTWLKLKNRSTELLNNKLNL